MENQNLITVVHAAFERDSKTVAIVKVSSDLTTIEKLDYAFRWTNNIDGSWSRRDIENNSDENENVYPLNVGKLGHRSTSEGDFFFLGHKDCPNAELYQLGEYGFNNCAMTQPSTSVGEI